jgi:two-component system response regulator DesR
LGGSRCHPACHSTLAGVDGARTAALLLTVFMVGIAMTWIRRMVVLIRELRAAREQVARLAVSDERLRFARDLHDLLGRTLSTIALKSQVARRMVRQDPAAAERELDQVGSLAQRSPAEVREAAAGYRQVTLAGELEGARSALAAAGIQPSVRADGTPAEAVDSVLAWTIREGVTNVIRHSGARRCDIVVHVDGSAATVKITDDGSGLPSIPLLGTDRGAGSGLGGLAEQRAPPEAGWRQAAARAAASGWPRSSRSGKAGEPGDQDPAGGGPGNGAGRPGDPPGDGRRPGGGVPVGVGDLVVQTAMALRPDVALLDIEIPGMDGLTAAAELHRALPDCRILILTTFARPGYLRRAIQAGASGFMVKDGPVEALAQAIRDVLDGRQVIDPALAVAALRADPDPLTQRERDVLAAAADGASVAEIAARLYLSEGTVRNYLSSAIGKVGARNRLEAIRIAEQSGWL